MPTDPHSPSSPHEDTKFETSLAKEPTLPQALPTPNGETRQAARRTSLLWQLALSLLLIALACLILYSFFALPSPEDPPSGPATIALPQRESPPLSEDVPTPQQDRLPLDPLIPETASALIEEGKRVADDLVQRYPRNPDAHEMLARFHYEFGQVERAVEAWQRCLELDPTYAYAHAGLAKAATQRGAHDEAVDHLRRAILVQPEVLSHQIELGKALLTDGEVDEALAMLQQVAATAPTSPEAHAELGAAQLQKRQDEAAKASFEAALKHDPEYPSAHFGLAMAYARLGNVEQAQEHQQKFSAFRDQRKEELHQQRVTYDDDQALRTDVAPLYAAMAGVYLSGGRSDAAEELWLRAARLDPTNRESRQGLARLYAQRSDFVSAIRVLRELARQDPASVMYSVEIARLYQALGRHEDAEQALQAFIQANPENATGHAALAEFLLHARGQPEQAEVHAEKAVQLASTVENWAILGAAREVQGDFAGAIAAIEHAAELAPHDPSYRQMLALLRRELSQSSGERPGKPQGTPSTPQDSP